MKVLKDGKEVKGAKVAYDALGVAHHVTVDGANYDVKAFELKDDEPVKKTRTAPTSRSKADGAMTTEDVATKKS